MQILDKDGNPLLPAEFISLKNADGFEIFYLGMDGEIRLKGKVLAKDEDLSEWCKIYYKQYEGKKG